MAAGFKFQSNAGNGVAVSRAAGVFTEVLEYPAPEVSSSNYCAKPSTPGSRKTVVCYVWLCVPRTEVLNHSHRGTVEVDAATSN